MTLDTNYRWPGPGAEDEDQDVLVGTLQGLKRLRELKLSDRTIWSTADLDGEFGLLDIVPYSVRRLELIHPELGMPKYFDDQEELDEWIEFQNNDIVGFLQDENYPHLRRVLIHNVKRNIDEDAEAFGWKATDSTTKQYTQLQTLSRRVVRQ